MHSTIEDYDDYYLDEPAEYDEPAESEPEIELPNADDYADEPPAEYDRTVMYDNDPEWVKIAICALNLDQEWDDTLWLMEIIDNYREGYYYLPAGSDAEKEVLDRIANLLPEAD